MGMELSNQRRDDEQNVLPPRKKARLERQLRAENILEQGMKPNGGPWLRSDTKHRQTAPIFSLPPEILYNIFSRLSIQERNRLAEVCKAWMTVVKDPIFNTSLTINKDGPTSFYVELLNSLPLLRELRIIERDDLPKLLRTLDQSNPMLEVLKIQGLIPKLFERRSWLPILRPTFDGLSSDLKYLKNLRKLSLTDVKLTFENDIRTFSTFENLKCLEMIDCDLNASFTDMLCSSPIQLEEFIYQQLFTNPIWRTESSYENFFRKMGSTLEVVKLKTSQISTFKWSCLAENCIVLKTLELRLGYKEVDGASLEALGTMQQLECLKLFEVRSVRASAWCGLLSNPSLRKIKTLGLSYSSVLDDSVFEVIGSNLKNLESIAISCHNANETALQHIIKNCSKLKFLTISLIRSKTTLQDFLLIPQYLPNLQVLTFRPTSDDHLVVEKKLETMIPGLKMNHVHNHADFL